MLPSLSNHSTHPRSRTSAANRQHPDSAAPYKGVRKGGNGLLNTPPTDAHCLLLRHAATIALWHCLQLPSSPQQLPWSTRKGQQSQETWACRADRRRPSMVMLGQIVLEATSHTCATPTAGDIMGGGGQEQCRSKPLGVGKSTAALLPPPVARQRMALHTAQT